MEVTFAFLPGSQAGELSMSWTMRSGSGYGRGFSKTAFTTVKMAVLAPMPSASVRTVTIRLTETRWPEHGSCQSNAQRVSRHSRDECRPRLPCLQALVSKTQDTGQSRGQEPERRRSRAPRTMIRWQMLPGGLPAEALIQTPGLAFHFDCSTAHRRGLCSPPRLLSRENPCDQSSTPSAVAPVYSVSRHIDDRGPRPSTPSRQTPT